MPDVPWHVAPAYVISNTTTAYTPNWLPYPRCLPLSLPLPLPHLLPPPSPPLWTLTSLPPNLILLPVRPSSRCPCRIRVSVSLSRTPLAWRRPDFQVREQLCAMVAPPRVPPHLHTQTCPRGHPAPAPWHARVRGRDWRARARRRAPKLSCEGWRRGGRRARRRGRASRW